MKNAPPTNEPEPAESRPGLESGIHAFGRPPVPLVEVVARARGVRDKTRRAASEAAGALKSRADRLDALLTEADELASKIEEATRAVQRGEERLGLLREALGGAEPNLEATLARGVDALLEGFEGSSAFPPHLLVSMASTEVMIRHRDRLLSGATDRWLAGPKERLGDLERRLREVQADIERVTSAE